MKEKIIIKMRAYDIYIFLFISLIVQMYSIKYVGVNYYLVYFLDGIELKGSLSYTSFGLFVWATPIYFILQVFSGKIKSMLNGYGSILIYRNYNKIKLLIIIIKNILVEMFFIILLQLMIFSVFNLTFIKIKQLILIIILYYLTFIVLIFIQLLLEMFVDPTVATILVCIYIIISVYFGDLCVIFNSPKWINYLFVPNYAMAFRNGLIPNQPHLVSYNIALVILILLTAGLVFLLHNQIKKRDII